MNKEYLKCINDPVYFIEHYCVMLTNKANKQIKLNEAQKNILSKIFLIIFEFFIYCSIFKL